MSRAWWGIAGVLFAVLATANAAGYRYGVSDQAFYIPVIARALDAGAFPRDGSLIDAQGRLMAADELAAALVRTTGAPLDLVFLACYLLSLALIWAAIVLIGQHVYRCRWLTIALGAAFTLRHRIPRTSANSFEPYFHPRMLAFGFGALAVAAVLTGRRWTAVVLVGAAAVVHVTTALWFAVLIGTALVVLHPVMRRLGAAAGAVAGVIAVWALIAGPLRSSLTTMDAVWLQAVASKDSLFATEWPLWAWLANLGLAGVLWVAHAVRTRRQQATPEDRALVWGATALVGGAPRAAAPGRMSAHRPARRDFLSPAALAAVLLVAASAARGAYVMLVERPERTLFAVHLPDTPWEGAMQWLAAQPRGIHVLADPGHAWKHGTSVRVSAQRDVLLEEVKDSAIAIYSRDVAIRVLERTAALGDFGALSAERARDLARRYDLDYLVTDADLPLPQAYRNAQFRIYHLK